MNYTVTDTGSLRNLCIANDWFTDGSIEQYEKLFYANEMRCTIEEIATIIWLCSNDNWCRRDILSILTDERRSYLKRIHAE